MPTDAEHQPLVFVVQKHQATTLHYDFRLEIGGVMPSWALPKGPPLESNTKRLAIPTTDHALAYRHFEGVIPAGQYGAGTVMIWDEGTYAPERVISKGVRQAIAERAEAEAAMRTGLQEGNLHFRLFGKKLHGSFSLLRMHLSGEKACWLLIKQRDEDARKV